MRRGAAGRRAACPRAAARAGSRWGTAGRHRARGGPGSRRSGRSPRWRPPLLAGATGRPVTGRHLSAPERARAGRRHRARAARGSRGTVGSSAPGATSAQAANRAARAAPHADPHLDPPVAVVRGDLDPVAGSTFADGGPGRAASREAPRPFRARRRADHGGRPRPRGAAPGSAARAGRVGRAGSGSAFAPGRAGSRSRAYSGRGQRGMPKRPTRSSHPSCRTRLLSHDVEHRSDRDTSQSAEGPGWGDPGRNARAGRPLVVGD